MNSQNWQTISIKVFQSPNGKDADSRPTDDWQPRHNIKQMFDGGNLKLDDDEAISSFSTKNFVEKELVKDHLQHLTTLERMKNLHTKDRLEKQQQRWQKCFDDYDWDTLCHNSKVQKLNIQELEKYLRHFNLPLKGKKNDKVRRVIAHVCNRQGEVLDTYVSPQRHEVLPEDTSNNDMGSNTSSDNSDAESDSEDDIIIAHYSSTDSSESESDSEETNSDRVPVLAQLSRQTRSGRNITTLFSRYRDCFLYWLLHRLLYTVEVSAYSRCPLAEFELVLVISRFDGKQLK